MCVTTSTVCRSRMWLTALLIMCKAEESMQLRHKGVVAELSWLCSNLEAGKCLWVAVDDRDSE